MEIMMATIYNPKYSLGQISGNFFKRDLSKSLSSFITDNFSTATTSVTASQALSQPQTSISNNIINQIMVDYGNGPVSDGLQILNIINSNVITGQNNSSNVFGYNLISGADIDFLKITNDAAAEIVLKNLSMYSIVSVSPDTYTIPYMKIINAMVLDLKSGTYDYSNYAAAILVKSRTLAQSASSIINGTNI